jgi:hypothetical protein
MACCKCVSHSCIFSAVCLLTTWTDTFLTVSCPLLKLPTHWNTVLQLGTASPHTDASRWWMSAANTPFLHKHHLVHLCPWQSPSIVHDSAPLTGAIIPLKRNLCHLLLPSIVWMFKYPCPVTHGIFFWLGICVHTLQQCVSNIYEWPSYVGFHVKDQLFLPDINAAWIFWTIFQKILRYQISHKSVQSFVSSVFHIYGSPVNCTCYLLLK